MMSLSNTIGFIINHPLNSGQKLNSVMRFAKWQVASRLAPGAIVFDWVNGCKFLVKNGETGLTGNIYTGLHEFPDMGFLLHFLRKEDLFIDIGANVGSYTLLACSAIGAKGVAFEPIPDTFNRLVANMRLNNLDDRVRCINKGLAAKEGDIAFTSANDTTNHALAEAEPCGDIINVAMTTVDAALNDESPALMKIDVEGYETPVLEGAQNTLKKPTLNAVIIELNGSGNRYGFDESRILELMLANGFKTYSYQPLERKLLSLEGKNMDSGNTLFVRDKLFVEERLRTAPKVAIHGKRF